LRRCTSRLALASLLPIWKRSRASTQCTSTSLFSRSHSVLLSQWPHARAHRSTRMHLNLFLLFCISIWLWQRQDITCARTHTQTQTDERTICLLSVSSALCSSFLFVCVRRPTADRDRDTIVQVSTSSPFSPLLSLSDSMLCFSLFSSLCLFFPPFVSLLSLFSFLLFSLSDSLLSIADE
jgi:hypothetical protein